VHGTLGSREAGDPSRRGDRRSGRHQKPFEWPTQAFVS
jgi:hypothetical protein